MSKIMNQLHRTYSFIRNHPLGRRHTLRAISKWIGWQLRSRLVAGPHSVPYVGNTRLLVTSGMHGATGNIYCGLHEFEDMAFALHFLREGDLFVDIGANIGSYTILASGACGARTLAVEPSKEAADRLQANIALNGLMDNVRIHRYAVGSERGTVKFSEGLDCINHVVETRETAGTSEVPLETVDCLVNGKSPVLLKIDVEGYERSVLLGATETLARTTLLAVIVEVNGSGQRYGATNESVFEIMEGIGMTSITYDPLKRQICEGRALQRSSGNVVFIRDQKVVQARLASAPQRRVLGSMI